jgi:ATP-dependent Clp protease ATP-binding subunit ClpC
MSSDLPDRPNLEHLKNQAKERLREMQLRDPKAKLADAQHAIAREYGFLNWSLLKEAVTSFSTKPAPVPQGQTTGLFARFTARAKQATFFSRYEAGRLGHPSIDPEHLLLGLVRARIGLKSRLLSAERLSVERIRSDVGLRRESGQPLSRFEIIPFSDQTKRAVHFAAAEADRLQHQEIGTAHLLLGLLCDERSLASALLQERGLSLDAVRQSVDDLLNEESS